MTIEIKLPPLPEGVAFLAEYGGDVYTAVTVERLRREAVETALADRQGEADPFQYIIQHLNSNHYALTKDECIQRVKELRTTYVSGTHPAPSQQPLSEEQIDSLLLCYGYDADDEFLREMLREAHGIGGENP